MNPAIQKALLHFVRLGLYAAASAILTYAVLPGVAALAHAALPAAAQPFVLVLIPVIIQVVSKWRDELDNLRQAEEAAKAAKLAAEATAKQ